MGHRKLKAKSDTCKTVSERIIYFFSQNWRVCIYALCGLGLCWIDLWRGIGNGAQWALAVNCTGFCVFPLIICRLDWKMLFPRQADSTKWHKWLRICLFGWILIFAVLAYPAFKYLAPDTDYDAQIVTAIANVGIYGALAIRMYFYIFHEKKNNEIDGKKDYKVTWIFFLWLAFIVMAIASVNKAVWPLWFLVMLGSFYVAPLKKGDMEEMADGLVTGMIIGFFWIQSRAFLYRPYDLDPRYRGHYTNPNVNAMFYMTTYVAWLTKTTIIRIKNKSKWLYAFSFFMSSSMWCFVFFTNCRSAIMGFAGITALYWFVESRFVGKKRIVSILTGPIIMCLCAAIAFMPVYWCMRYIPPLRHHPIWYGGEYGGNNVMSGDPIDSPKYMELEYILKSDFGRVYLTYDNEPGEDAESESISTQISWHAAASLSEPSGLRGEQYSPDGDEIYWYEDGVQPGADPDHPVYVRSDYSSTLLRKVLKDRYYIYRYMLSNVHVFGNDSTDVPWIFPTFALYHAHNTVLQISYWFGGVAGVLFLGLLLIPVFRLFVKLGFGKISDKDKDYVPMLFSLIAIAGYLLAGLTECIAFPGEMGLILFFLTILPNVRVINE